MLPSAGRSRNVRAVRKEHTLTPLLRRIRPVFAVVAACAILQLTSCIEIQIVSASVVSGPDASGAATLRLALSLDLGEEFAQGTEGQPPQPVANQIGYLAVATPRGVHIQGARLLGPPAMTGADGVRRMGPAPQVAAIYGDEFVGGDEHEWHAFHVIVDVVEPAARIAVAVELDLVGVQSGEHLLYVAPGMLEAAGTDLQPGELTGLMVVSNGGKALVDVVRPGKGVQ